MWQGFLSVQRLTTNVTGHFAFFVDEVFKLNFYTAFIFFLYTLFFLFGFLCFQFAGGNHKQTQRTIYLYHSLHLMESLILFAVAFGGQRLVSNNPDLIAYSLLFAMGLQKLIGYPHLRCHGKNHTLNGALYRSGHRVVAVVFLQRSRAERKTADYHTVFASESSSTFFGEEFLAVFFTRHWGFMC
jgi:uncharacterized membrane protein YoaK (UPF0700 family)